MNMAYLILGGGRGRDRALFQALTIYYVPLGFPGVSVVTNLPAMPELWARSLGLEDPLEAGMATDSSVLVFLLGESHGQWSLVGCSSWGLQRIPDRTGST